MLPSELLQMMKRCTPFEQEGHPPAESIAPREEPFHPSHATYSSIIARHDAVRKSLKPPTQSAPAAQA